jgi:glyoxylate reductase
VKRVFVTALLPGSSIDRLKEMFEVEVLALDRPAREDELLRGARNADALVTMVADPVRATLIEACPRLLVIANCGVGYENIDVDAATKRGIIVTNTPGVLTEAVADLAWALVLAVARRVAEGDSFVRRGMFKGWLPTLMLGKNIHGRVLGVFGMGSIGTAIAKRAKGFSMQVIYHNRSRNIPGEEETGARWVPLPELLKASDVLVIAAPLTPETRGRFGMEEFQRMKRSSILVNVGRGQIVKEKELVEALRRGVIWGAGLDVYEREPEVEEELAHLPNTVLLPHVGSATEETRTAMADIACQSVADALTGRAPAHIVNPAALKRWRERVTQKP